VRNNILMNEIQSHVHDFWQAKFRDRHYISLVESHPDYTKHTDAIDASNRLPWGCVLHRSEEGKPINTEESAYATRIVSIHASQVDGRRVAYVVGLSEGALKCFSSEKINLKYESLLNVAISRMKEVVRVWLVGIPDDIWKRFLPLMSTETAKSVPPTINVNSTYNLKVEPDKLDTNVLKLVRREIESNQRGECEEDERPLVDYGHHVVRMAVANTTLWHRVVMGQVDNDEFDEQVLTVFIKIGKMKIKPMESKYFYKEMKSDNKTCIPILRYDTGHAMYSQVHDKILEWANLIQKKYVTKWVRQQEADIREITPAQMVILQYMVETVTNNIKQRSINMDHIYDVVHCYMRKNDSDNSELAQHYDYLNNINSIFDQVVAGHQNWSWKINRSINVGNKVSGSKTSYFTLNSKIGHIFVTDAVAMPVILYASVDELNMSGVCADAILSSLVCTQPEMIEGSDKKGNPTWVYVKGKQIKVCLISVKHCTPIIVDLIGIIEENITAVTEWIREYVEQQGEVAASQAMGLVRHFGHDFEKVRDKVANAYAIKRCPDFVKHAVDEADGMEDIENMLKYKLNVHLKAFMRDIRRRA